jgi:putative membrane protein
VIGLLIQIVINAVALIVAAYLVPQFVLKLGEGNTGWVQLAIVALVFALVNTFIKPLVKALSLPISFLTLGLFSFVINAALLLLVAWISTEKLKITFTIGTFPPHFTSDTIVGAILASIVISVVSTVLGMTKFAKRL